MNSNDQSLDEIDDLLKKITKVDSPEFLLTRIHSELGAQLQEQIPLPYALGSMLVVALLLLLNIWTIQNYISTVDVGGVIVIEGMNLMPENGFY